MCGFVVSVSIAKVNAAEVSGQNPSPDAASAFPVNTADHSSENQIVDPAWLPVSYAAGAGEGVTVSLANPANQVKLFRTFDALVLFITSRPFPSGTLLFLLPDSPMGLNTNTFDAHARQSHLGALFSGPEVLGLEPSATLLAFIQNDNFSADDYGLQVYYAYGDLKNADWRFAAGL